MEYNVNGALRSCLTQQFSSHWRGVKSGDHGQKSVSGIVEEEMLIFKQIIVKDTHLSVEQSKITVDRKRLESTGGRIQELRSLDSFSGEKLAHTHNPYDNPKPAFEDATWPP